MAISKLILNNTTQMDVTTTTATPSDVASGKTFLKADGTIGVGEATMGSEWTELYRGTTTEEAILRILVDNISVKEVEVWIYTPTYSSDYVYYVPLMQTSATHYEKTGYLRMTKSKGGTTTQPYATFMKFEGCKKDGTGEFFSSSHYNAGEDNVKCTGSQGLSNMTVGMTITSLAVATYVNTPAGTTVIVRGK